MAKSPMSSIAFLGVFGAMAMVMMLLMSLGGVTDPAAGGIAGAVHTQLKRSLHEDKQTTRLTMRLEGKGVDAPRHYTLTLTPSPAVAASDAAVKRLLMRAAGIVSGQLTIKKQKTTIRCVAKRGERSDVEATFQRVPGPNGRVDLLPVETAVQRPPPPTERPPPPDAPAREPNAPKDTNAPKETQAPAVPPQEQPAKPAEEKDADAPGEAQK